MKLRKRCADVKGDKNVLLELHCAANYASETPWARRTPYGKYRDKWLSTPQPAAFLSDLARSLRDRRTITEIWETDCGEAAAYAWVTFTDVEGYGITIADVRDIAVAEGFRRRGIGAKILRHIEAVARRNGAAVLRSETGVENAASQALHRKSGFAVHRIDYEKVLSGHARTQTTHRAAR
jgi:GNAT superfamily N-acetyltransferase